MTESMTELERYIWHLPESYADGPDSYEPGYYFEDESACLNGPYESVEQAKAALKQYCEKCL